MTFKNQKPFGRDICCITTYPSGNFNIEFRDCKVTNNINHLHDIYQYFYLEDQKSYKLDLLHFWLHPDFFATNYFIKNEQLKARFYFGLLEFEKSLRLRCTLKSVKVI